VCTLQCFYKFNKHLCLQSGSTTVSYGILQFLDAVGSRTICCNFVGSNKPHSADGNLIVKLKIDVGFSKAETTSTVIFSELKL